MSFASIKLSENVIKWLEQLLCERLGEGFKLRFTDEDSVSIFYCDSLLSIKILQNTSEFYTDSKKVNCPIWDSTGWNAPVDRFIPAPGWTDASVTLVEKAHFGYQLNYNILGLMYWSLTRQEEVFHHGADSHQRFLSEDSHCKRYDYLSRPIVDEWIEILKQIVKTCWPEIAFPKSGFRVSLSHDVDRPSKYVFKSLPRFLYGLAGDCLRLDFSSLLLSIQLRFSSEDGLSKFDPFNTFEWIMDLSEESGFLSSFYFLCGVTNKEFDADYSISDPKIILLINDMARRGHVIGLHPSYDSLYSSAIISVEFERLKNVCVSQKINQLSWSSRMHYLRWSHPHTLLALDSAGISVDSTMGFADHVGFRCGTCHDYQAYDIENDCPMNIRIQPLIVMDQSILSKKYMSISDIDLAVDIIIDLKESCEAVSGVFTMLWHNTSLTTDFERELYKRVVLSL